MDRFDAGRQPAGRAPAPGRLAFVQAFLNSFWDLDAGGVERWSDTPAYVGWLHERGFQGAATADDLATAIALREALRALALANHDDVPAPAAEAALDRIAARVAPRAGLTPRFASDGGAPGLDVAGTGPDAALALVLGIVFAARLDGTWPRLKACPHARCGWAFYDRSRNRSSQWCSMRICGNRTKGARHRDRAAQR